MKAYYLVAFWLAATFHAVAQEVTVKDFMEKQSDLQARTNPRTDRNGNPCALVKVVLPILEGATFEGWVIDTKHIPGEYQVYVPEGTKKITLRHPSILPKVIEFDPPLQGKHTYQVTIVLPQKTTNATIARIVTNVKKAEITIGGKTYDTETGEFNVALDKGEYDYTLKTDVPGFSAKSGHISIKGEDVVENLDPIYLETNESRVLTVRCEKDTRLKIAGREIGKLKDNMVQLPAGVHRIDAYMGNGDVWYKTQEVDLTYQDATIDMSLRGSLRITYPANAEFKIIPLNNALKPSKDKIKTGETVFLLGDYTIEVNKKNYSKSLSSVSIGVNNTVDNYRIEVTSKGDDFFQGVNGRTKSPYKAYKEYKKLADKGDDIAQYRVGCCLMDGSGYVKDPKRAMTYWMKSAAQNNPDALMKLVEYTVNDMERFRYCQKAAELGNAEALCMTGDMYLEGRGIDRNYGKALEIYTEAAGYHQEKALRRIGDIYYYGLGVDRDAMQAREYYTQAALEGDEVARENVANLDYEAGEQDKAVQVLASLPSLTDRSLVNLGNYYFRKQDYPQSVHFFQKVRTFDKGMGKTLADLADRIYDTDKFTAVSFYEKSLALGFEYPTSARRIGLYYINTPNKVYAYNCLMQASAMKDPEGTCYLGYCFEKGIGTGKDNRQAISYYRKAIDLGYMKAYRFLGTMYMNGTGVPENQAEAVRCWKIAAEAGSNEAVKNLIKYYQFRHNQAEVNKWKRKLSSK